MGDAAGAPINNRRAAPLRPPMVASTIDHISTQGGSGLLWGI
eukprot:gene30474-35487_t